MCVCSHKGRDVSGGLMCDDVHGWSGDQREAGRGVVSVAALGRGRCGGGGLVVGEGDQ